jgi:hypothetical protein
MWSHAVRILVLAGLGAALCGRGLGASDPLARYTPRSFADAAGRARIDTGGVLVDVLPAHGRDLAIVGAARTQADGPRLVEWVQRVEALQKSTYVPAVVRFSDPPRIEDLSGVRLGATDLEDLRRCRPGDCGLKLSAPEIERVRAAIAVSGSAWQPVAQAHFRQLMLERALSYLSRGDAGTPPYDDHGSPVEPGVEFQAVASRMRAGDVPAPLLLDYLSAYPALACPGVESFLYWSQEELGSGKPIISITHVAILRSLDPALPETMVASRQVFATHYLSASLSLTALTHPVADGTRYLLYARHSRVDLFRGPLAGVIRRMVQKRIRADAPAVLDAMRRRLESGAPPQ